MMDCTSSREHMRLSELSTGQGCLEAASLLISMNGRNGNAQLLRSANLHTKMRHRVQQGINHRAPRVATPMVRSL